MFNCGFTPTSVGRARFAVSAVYLAIVAWMAGPALAASLKAEFEPCHVDRVEAQARCAYLPVPMDWSLPDGPTIDLFVAVVPPSGGAVVDSPIYILAGGPGQAASDLGALIDGAMVPARRGREVILVDQRGTGRTAPFDCPTPSDPNASGSDVARACLAASKHDPRQFGSDAFVNDLHAVRNALGHGKIHLWGGSYGTRAALLYLARFEHTVKSVTLDAVAPPATPFMTMAMRTAGDSLTRVLEACASDTACAAAFPTLEQDLERIVAELDAAPRSIRLNGRPTRVDAAIFLNGLRNAFYTRASTAWVPYVIHEFARDNAAPWAAMADAAGGIMDGISLGTLLSVMCGEEQPRLEQRGSAPGNTPFANLDLVFWSDACAVWPAATPPAELDSPVTSDVPVLLLSGALDPVTPPAYAEDAASTLTNARHVIAPFNAHITTPHGCAPKILGVFLDTLDPAGLDVECIQDVGEAPFLLGPAGPNP